MKLKNKMVPDWAAARNRSLLSFKRSSQFNPPLSRPSKSLFWPFESHKGPQMIFPSAYICCRNNSYSSSSKIVTRPFCCGRTHKCVSLPYTLLLGSCSQKTSSITSKCQHINVNEKTMKMNWHKMLNTFVSLNFLSEIWLFFMVDNLYLYDGTSVLVIYHLKLNIRNNKNQKHVFSKNARNSSTWFISLYVWYF